MALRGSGSDLICLTVIEQRLLTSLMISRSIFFNSDWIDAGLLLLVLRTTFFWGADFGLVTEARFFTAFFLAIGIFQDVSLVSVSQKMNRSQITAFLDVWSMLTASFTMEFQSLKNFLTRGFSRVPSLKRLSKDL